MSIVIMNGYVILKTTPTIIIDQIAWSSLLHALSNDQRVHVIVKVKRLEDTYFIPSLHIAVRVTKNLEPSKEEREGVVANAQQ